MKIIVLFAIVASLMGLPVYMLDTQVMPELISLQQTYAGFDAQAAEVTEFAAAE